MSGQEPRRGPRVPHAFIVRYRPAGEAASGWLVSPLRDLSSHGARFLSERDFPVGASLDAQLQLGLAQQPVHLTARVAWVKPAQLMKMHELGITFDPGDPAAQQAIDAAVNRFIQKAKG
jgi:hypothetical protein